MTTMVNLISQLQETNSSTEKVAILNRVKNDPVVKRAFELACDKDLVSNVSKVDLPTGRPGSLSFESAFAEFDTLFMSLYSREITGDEARSEVQAFLSKCTPKAQVLFVNILKKDLRCGVSRGTCQKVWGPDFCKTFSVQLANKYDPKKKYDTGYWYASPKLDGLRCFFDAKSGTIKTRSGKAIVGFDKMASELRVLCKSMQFAFVDGELFSDKVPFQKIQGCVTRKVNINEAEKEQIYLNVFAVGPAGTTAEMICQMDTVEWDRFPHLRQVKYTKIKNDKAVIERVATEFVEMGYEGVMLRDPRQPYDWKRSDALLKFKFFKEEDFVMVGFNVGTGKYANTLGAIMVEGKAEGKPVIADVGSGLSDEMRAYIWSKRAVLKGKKVEVKYQNLTDRPINGKWSLRFPIFRKLKEDR